MNNLTRVVFGMIFLLAIGYNTYGQQPVRVPVRGYAPVNRVSKQNAARKMEHLKELFIGSRLKLTSSEAREFWPLYRRYVQDQTAIKILKHINISKPSSDNQIPDKELEYEAELVNIRKRYRDEFYKVLPSEKVSELYKSERAFNDEVLKQLSERSIRAGN